MAVPNLDRMQEKQNPEINKNIKKTRKSKMTDSTVLPNRSRTGTAESHLDSMLLQAVRYLNRKTSNIAPQMQCIPRPPSNTRPPRGSVLFLPL
jgi:hypothetical protein